MPTATLATSFPLTTPQREIWFDQALHAELPLYNIGGAVSLPTAIDPDCFTHAVTMLLQRHDALRLVLLDDDDGIPLQSFSTDCIASVFIKDFSAEANADMAAQAWMQQRFIEPFTLRGQVLFRYDLVKVHETQWYWLMQYHHLIVDGYSVALLHRELMAIYSQLAAGQMVVAAIDSSSYQQWINYNNTQISPEQQENARHYWAAKHPQAPAPLFPRRTPAICATAVEPLPLSDNLNQQIQTFAKQHHSSMFQIWLALLVIYFSRSTQRPQIPLGYATLNRPQAEFQDIAGMFTLAAAGHFTVNTQQNFTEFLAVVRQTIKADLAHPYSLTAIQQRFAEQRHNLFDIMLTYQRFTYDSQCNGVATHTQRLKNGAEQTPLTIYLKDYHAGTDIVLDFSYNLAYFKQKDIQRLQQRLLALLQHVLAQPELPLAQISLLSAAESAQLQRWNPVQTNQPKSHTLINLFQQQVEQTPDNIALMWQNQQLSYRTLNQKANQLARAIRIATRAQHECLIGIYAERSIEMLVSILAVLKAGAAYVPLDPHYPAERLRWIVEDSGVSVLLTQTPLPEYPIKQLNLHNWRQFEAHASDNLDIIIAPEQLAYVIYTSGSTGKPKGVMIEHHTLAQHAHTVRQCYAIEASDKVLQFASFAFDASIEQWLCAWMNGACSVLVDGRMLSNEAVLQELQDKQVSVAEFPPAYWQHLLDTQEQLAEQLPPLRCLILSGDNLPPALLERTQQQLPQLCCYNSYGPTEATIAATLHSIPAQWTATSNVPIGKPLANTRCYILDQQQQVLPIGVAGELCIAGGLARGYLNRPELTAEKFLELELFGNQERIYRTGDLARWLPDGNLAFLGRIDHQIKLRGFRIELGEIEAVLTQHKAVNDSVVVLHEQTLAAYLVLHAQDKDNTLVLAELREHLQSQLPDYMQPSSFTLLEQLPLNANGKIDRKQLPKPDLSLQALEVLPLRDDTDQLLATLWSQLLAVEVDSRSAHFFYLGGHSLLATQLISRIRANFDIEMPLRVLFDHPTLGDLADWLHTQQRGTALPRIQAQPKDAPLLMSYDQEIFWLREQLEQTAQAHNMFCAWTLRGALNISALRTAFQQLVLRHRVLRQIFPDHTQVRELSPFDPLHIVEQQVSTSEIEQYARVQMQTAFDLTQQPLLRVQLLRCADEHHVLLLTIHHILSDAWSLRIIERDWRQLYALTCGETQTALPALPLAYTDYAAWQRELFSHDDNQYRYWQNQLQGAPERLALPTDYPRSTHAETQGATHNQTLPPELVSAIEHFAQQAGCTAFMVLFSAFNLLLYRWSGQTDLCVGVPVVNRQQTETENLVGIFINMLVLRSRLHRTQHFSDLLQHCRQTILDAQQHANLPFARLLQQLPQTTQQRDYNPYFQVAFNLVTRNQAMHSSDTSLHIESLQLKQTQQTQTTYNLDLFVTLEPTINKGLAMSWLYDANVFKASRIEFLSESYLHLLQQLLDKPDQTLQQFHLADTQTPLYPLTCAQRSIWFESAINRTIGGYVHLPFAIDEQRFNTAVNHLIQTHDNLRIQLSQTRDEQAVPEQTIVSTLQYTVPIHDFRSADNPKDTAQRWMQQRFTETLEEQTLFSYNLLRIADAEYYCSARYHSLIADNWTVALLNRALGEIYTALSYGKICHLDNPSYKDGILTDQRNSEQYPEQGDSWLQQFQAHPTPLFQPSFAHRKTEPQLEQAFVIPATLCQLGNFTPADVLLVAFTAYFLRTEQAEACVVGVPILNRHTKQHLKTAGIFKTCLPLTLKIEPQTNLVQLLQQIETNRQNYAPHQAFPVSQLKSTTQPCCDIVLNLVSQGNTVQFGKHQGTFTALRQTETSVPLHITIEELADATQLQCHLIAHPAYFSAEQFKVLPSRLLTWLQTLLEQSTQPLVTLNLLPEAEIQQLQQWNQTAVDYPLQQNLVSLFEQQAAQTPEHIAAVFETQALSYRELNQKANQVARLLQAHLGNGKHLIGLCVERSLDMLMGVLGILKAGAAYVPLDPNYPTKRLAWMLEDSQISLLLTQRHLQTLFEPHLTQLHLDDWGMFQQQANNNLNQVIVPEQLAYVMYTSGSTGQPKAVMIQHRSVINLSYAQIAAFQISANSCILQFASFSFDAAVSEILTALLSGARLQLVSKDTLLSMDAFVSASQTVTHFTLPPSYLANLPQDALPNCHTLVTAGEALPLPLLQQWAAKVRLLNAYGPTETTVCASIAECNAAQSLVHIGQAMANTRIYILDERQQPLPIGVAGELCIAGIGLAQGYRQRPKLTAEKFLDVVLFGQRERIYRTGDHARWLPNGMLEYLGRGDQQVKLRGFRIELGEIEATLRQHNAVQHAVVVVREQALAAYVVLHASTLLPENILHDFLHARLADYMIPNSFTYLDNLPLTPNGKIDRNALPEPEAFQHHGEALRDATEHWLATLWSQLLQQEVSSRSAHFFELGGHSLLGTQLIAHIRRHFAVEMPLHILFEQPVLGDLSTWLQTQQRGSVLPDIQPQASDAALVMSFAQQRLWFLTQLADDSTIYNIPVALRLTGASLDTEALRHALELLMARQQSLRLYFPSEGIVAELAHYDALSITDLRTLPTIEQEARVHQIATSHARQVFDLSTGPLFQVTLLLLAEQQHVLLINMHHIISDGWSVDILLREWHQLYSAICQDEMAQLPPLPICYTDYAAWQYAWLQDETWQQQKAYWRQHLADAPERLELPTDFPRPAVQSYRGAQYRHSLSDTLSQQVKTVSQTYDATPFMTLLAAFTVLLARDSGQDDISLGTPIADRSHQQTENMIGFFVNTLVLRSQFKREDNFKTLLNKVKSTTLQAYVNKDLPFDTLVETLNPDRSLSYSPLFQVMFVLQNTPDRTASEYFGCQTRPLGTCYSTAKFDLLLSVHEEDGCYHCIWDYATDLFTAVTQQRRAKRFELLLEQLLAQPEQPMCNHQVLTPAETQLLQQWNQTETGFPKPPNLVALFEQQVEQHSEQIAVSYQQQHLTYWQLNQRANQVARCLRQHTTASNPVMAICIERSFDRVIGLLGILKAGGAYAPIDPDYPTERLQHMLHDSAASILLTQTQLKVRLPATKARVICIDTLDLNAQSTDNLHLPSDLEDLTYVIYTSGSTGKPKGIAMPQRALLNLMHWQLRVFTQPEKTLQFTSLNFDVSFQEIWGTWLQGGQLVLVDDNTRRDPSALLEYLAQQQIERMFAPFVMLQHLAESFVVAENPNLALQNFITAGEQLRSTPAIRHFFTCLPNCRLHNHYGPSETHVITALTLDTTPAQWDDLPSIGKPIDNHRIYLLDAHLQPVPIGIVGELYIAGAGLAHGYLNRAQLNAEKFTEVELFGKRERVYCSGDLARWLPNGELEFLGRVDHQVKLRGFRVELGEIEAVLAQHEAVQDCVVVLHEEQSYKSLAAYIVLVAGKTADTQTLRQFLSAQLPDYMLPSSFTLLDALPLTPNGKTNRKALPKPQRVQSSQVVMPRNITELRLQQLWQTIFQHQHIGVHDNFFDLGGHSLLAAKLMSHIQQHWQQRLPLATLFQAPTIAQLAQHLHTPHTIQSIADA